MQIMKTIETDAVDLDFTGESLFEEDEELLNTRLYTTEEVFEECCDILSEHYGCDVKTL
jgi:hypothetical protein